MKKATLFFLVFVFLFCSVCNADVLIDQLDDEERRGGFGLTVSHISEDESVSCFRLSERVKIGKFCKVSDITVHNILKGKY